jgi:heme/copper-type cytochrome/quinol oxidase subunit 3
VAAGDLLVHSHQENENEAGGRLSRRRPSIFIADDDDRWLRDEAGRAHPMSRPVESTADAPVIVATIVVISGEVMLFAGLVFGFWVLRLAAPAWPPPLQPRLPVAVTGANTLVLLASAVAMAAAVNAAARGDRRRLLRWLRVTAGLGALFLAVQGYEWLRLVGFGLTVSSGLYGATFYTLIGAHAAHVAVALGWVGVIAALASRGRLGAERRAPLLACAAYWSFVVGLWPVLYVSVYLA